MRRIGLTIAGTAMLAAVAPAGAQQSSRDERESAVVWSGRLSDGGLLTIKNIVGAIRVVEASGDRVEVRAAVRSRGGERGEIAFDVDPSSSSTTICTVFRDQSACERNNNFRNMRVSVDYTVAMPRGLRLRATTGNGDLSVDRAGGEVEMQTGNGAVHVGETEGRVSVGTGNGEVEVESARGPVRAQSGNGRIFVSTSEGPVSAQTGNGDIDVRMKTLSDAADMHFQSGSGSIRVTLPSNFNGQLEASTGNGELRSDFEIEIRGRLDPRHMRGVIGRGGRLIRMQTGNGRIEIRKG
jgi:Putative adhesin